MFLETIRLGYAFCGSFCTIKDSLCELEKLCKENYDVTAIMSQIVYNTDTRFIKADDLKEAVKKATGKEIIHDITGAEPIGPKALFDILVVSPCTGNTLAKIALGITDTPVTMAVKAHLRNRRPVVLGLATNDALSASAKNIGALLNTKNIYFVPFGQDDPDKKETSMICDFTLIKDTVEEALCGKQIKPLLI
ncbi:MAG: dipicolinate synthase subunit B [Clostridia bacterium]|nr:dipicolinate synthase subunit B [Clostridia bacterium]